MWSNHEAIGWNVNKDDTYLHTDAAKRVYISREGRSSRGKVVLLGIDNFWREPAECAASEGAREAVCGFCYDRETEVGKTDSPVCLNQNVDLVDQLV